MANHKPKGKEGGDRQRPPPTIDLRATEIAASDPPPPDADTSQPAPDPEPSPSNAEAAADTGDAVGAAPAEPPPPDPQAAADHGRLSPPPTRFLWPVLGGALAGGAIAAIVLVIAWSQWVGSDHEAALARQAQRIGNIEAEVRELAARKPEGSVDSSAIEGLSRRLGKVEAAASAAPAPDSTVSTRLTALEQTIGGLKERLDVLDQRSDKTAAALDAVRQRAETAATGAASAQSAHDTADTLRRDIVATNDRLAALEATTGVMQTKLTQQQANLAKERAAGADDRPVRLAVAAEALKLAVARGERFRTELDVAKALAPDPAPLAPLEAFAERGVPTAAALGGELVALIPEMRRLAGPPSARETGILTRLQASAERLVRIQPIGAAAGDDPTAILARLEAHAADGNIGGVLADLDKLPPQVRAPAEVWLAKVHARDAALDAGEKFAATALGALAPRSE